MTRSGSFLAALAFACAGLLPAAPRAQDAPVDRVPSAEEAPAVTGPQAVLHTSMGDITLELYPQQAPRTVQNFVEYARAGFYNGTIFHRVIPDMLVQAGAYTPDMQPKPTRAPIPLETQNGLSNLRGTVAAARAAAPESATSQFFINVVDNPRFDFTSDESDYTRGYAVFARVVDGMDVVDAIREVPTTAREPLQRDVPVEPVTIERVELLDAE
ncbi:peptidylprolyl isomerase [Coralloluteibacterium stylophorae]|uniref:Peptidyl-prolyl cis-trans isomerase n=1 Tax=Coralloluteibacterium stylophorae TaxID=1776034 RepID=A0A8J7VV95_9GAMM|nr:peptidylprolyl isomerase [Coralloluteibacterium stylophorae]MBS7456529.1 peptidylprolyl isomerase [Coralloluteibacterium stylophorae]